MIAPTGGMTSDGLKKILGGGTCISKKRTPDVLGSMRIRQKLGVRGFSV